MRGGRGPREQSGEGRANLPPPPSSTAGRSQDSKLYSPSPNTKARSQACLSSFLLITRTIQHFIQKKIVLIIYLYSVHAPVPGTDLFLVVFIPKDKKGAPGAHRGGGKGRPSPTPMVPPHGKGTGAPRMVWGHSGGGDSQHPWMLWVLHNHRDVNENRALRPRRG